MKKIIIIGGGAAGAGAAAKCRRLSEESEIKIYEKGKFVSYSNCGLPFYFSKRIKTFDDLILNSPERLKGDYNIDSYVAHEVCDLDVIKKSVYIHDIVNDNYFWDSYDELIIASGVQAIRPNIPGIEEAKNIFSLKTPDDVKKIDDFLKKNKKIDNVVVIGGGFIGAELAENFKIKGIKNVTIIDKAAQLMLPADNDFAAFIHQSFLKNGVKLHLGQSVESFENDGRVVVLENGEKIKADLIFLTIGVKPELKIFEKNGLLIGKTGAIKVDLCQRTSIKNVYAVGDICESVDINGEASHSLLATPASRMATIAANTIFEIKDKYRGSQGTSALSVFDCTVACVGKNERQLQEAGVKYHKSINARPNHLGIMGGENIFCKIIYDDNGVILGAQAAGPHDSAKRITYIAICMMHKATIYDLVEYQVAYNPIVDTSFDVINMAGRINRLKMNNVYQDVYAEQLKALMNEGWKVIDVRFPEERETAGYIQGSINIPWHELRSAIVNLDKQDKYILHCKTGMRSYNANLIMLNNGFKNVRNLAGGFDFWQVYDKYAKLDK